MKVLVADVARTAALFAGHEVTTGRTLAGVRAVLQKGGFELLVVGTKFDDSRMFDLVREVRADPRHDGLRIVCIVPTRTLMPACAALNAEAVLEGEAISVAALISGGTP